MLNSLITAFELLISKQLLKMQPGVTVQLHSHSFQVDPAVGSQGTLILLGK